MKTPQQSWRKTVALAAMFSLIFGQAIQSVQAASTNISDVPLAVKNQAAANIMFTLDDSGSMHFEFIPEEEMRFSIFLHPRPTSPYGGGDFSNQLPNFNDANLHNFYGRSAANNKLYYNPDVTYLPWSNSDGSLMANASPTAAFYNPTRTVAGSINLTLANTISAVWFSDAGTGDLNQAFCDPGCGANHTFQPITYFNYNGGSKTLRASYTKVELTDSQATSTPATANITSPSGIVRTRTAEIQNFANWFQYYRSRVLTARAGTGRAFSQLGTTPRVGFAAINVGSTSIDGVTSPGAIVQGVRPFTGTDRTNFFTTLYGHVIPTSATPLRRAMDDVGQYFSRTDDRGPWGATPGSTGGTQHSCRQNFHILTTDGYWNGAAAPTTAATANVDNANGATITSSSGATFQYTPASPFSDAFGDTLADVAMYYWNRDLRPDLTNNVTVAPDAPDPAFWQHVSTFTVSIGLTGSIPVGKTQLLLAALSEFPTLDTNKNGFLSTTEAAASSYFYPPSSSPAAPAASARFTAANTDTADSGISSAEFVAIYGDLLIARFDTNANGVLSAAEVAGFPELATNFAAFDTNSNGSLALTELSTATTWPDPLASDPNKIDDLAHAAVNGRGGFFVASDPDTFASSLAASLNGIAARTGAAAAVAVANANVTGTDNASYASSYNSGTWTGDLQAFPLNLTTGEPITTTPVWTSSAQAQLNLLAVANRKIATYSGTAGTNQGIQFQPTTATTATKLSAAQQTLLNSPTSPPGPTDGAAVVNYLRGDRSGETAGTYRSRTHVLGDIVNAEPVVVREPFFNYVDTGYSTFKTSTANTTRTRIVLQGANDGLLHAFNGATGAEEWAYVPNLLMASLNNLSRKGTLDHKFLVDGTPVVGDVDFSNTDGVTGNPAADWRTIVVGGLGKGGRGYYALDVTSTTAVATTSPVATAEAVLAKKVLWEFPNSATTATVKANIGFSFGRPLLTKTNKGWVVLVPSGYNNGTNTGDSGGDGKGYLFVLNAKTGALIRAIGTGVGSVTDPSGLAYISGFIEAQDTDNTVAHVYGGDLKGNVWRFDLTAANTSQWSATRLATLVDGSNNFQPITTEPEVTTIDSGGGVFKRFVYVGTGLYLGDTDIVGAAGANTHSGQTQTMYGLIDDLTTPAASTTTSAGTTTPLITPLLSNLQAQTFTVNVDGSRTASAIPLDFTTKKGWFINLPSTGERVNTNPALALGALVFTTNIPSTNICEPGGSSFFNVLDYKTGGYLTGSTAPWSSQSLGNALASRVVLIKLPSGKVKGLARKSDGTTVSTEVPLPASSGTAKRKSWRELTQ